MGHTHKHTFALCAFEESPHLEDCIKSLENQSVKSRIIICTATPNDYIKNLAAKHSLELFIREGSPNISDDWNFAVEQADSQFVTIAHQDDIYESDYAKIMLEQMSKASKPLIFFSDYSELRNGDVVFDTKLLNIKRDMLKKLVDETQWSNIKTRRRALSLGSPICCPSVTLNLEYLKSPVFHKGFKCNLDWDAWERISKEEGDFVYSPERLMQHRIHEGSETTKLIKDKTRTKEDLLMFKRFWPSPFANIINAFYSSAQKSN